MLLTPDLINTLRAAAKKHRDDAFFGIRSKDREFFVFNWTFGMRFTERELTNCDELRELEDETDRICSISETKRDIIRHIYTRSWMDILVGTGIYQDADLMRLSEEEEDIFAGYGWGAIPFETDNGRRFYVKEAYFDAAEDTIKNVTPIIFRPINSSTYPGEYRPMLFQDEDGEMRGLVYAISEDNMRNPVEPADKYSGEIDRIMQEQYGR